MLPLVITLCLVTVLFIYYGITFDNSIEHYFWEMTRRLKNAKLVKVHEVENEVHPLCQRYVNTRKYVPQCMNTIPEKLYTLLITGLGGAGSHHVSLVLGMTHECVDGFGAVVS